LGDLAAGPEPPDDRPGRGTTLVRVGGGATGLEIWGEGGGETGRASAAARRRRAAAESPAGFKRRPFHNYLWAEFVATGNELLMMSDRICESEAQA
jgi:hypothetical protein